MDLPQRFFRENLDLGGGEEGATTTSLGFERTGASVMGKRMFDLGEQSWPEEAPFHTPVFVVTRQQRDRWERPGGTTFHFVNDGITAPGPGTQVWDTSLASPSEGPDTWFHDDVRPGNLLVSDGRLRAVIDFGIAGVGDPACDITIAPECSCSAGRGVLLGA